MTGRSIRVKITPAVGTPWYASSWCTMPSAVRHVQRLNEYAKNRGVAATYELATEEEYKAYQDKCKGATYQRNRDPDQSQLDL